MSDENKVDELVDDQIMMSLPTSLSSGCSSFWLIGLKILRENIGKIDLKEKLISGIIDLIAQDRINTSVFTRDTVGKLIHILLALQIYKGDFETEFIQTSKQHYLGQQIQESDNLSLYLLKVEEILRNEALRVKECLDISTLQLLIHTVQQVLISEVS